ncbi:hypothetical protein FO519_008560 [Halicephalobus sp. NKZ332]|nr:hypothetical protein FO519_008560 [Halicephalobus sp. NKZ332]
MKDNQFFNSTASNIFITYINIITIITLSLAPIHFYIILTQSSTLKRFKWFLLNHSFWCLCYLLSFAVFKPVLLLYAPCGFMAGIFRNTSREFSIMGVIFTFGFAILSIGGVCILVLCSKGMIDIPQEVMIQQALKFSPDLEQFTHEKSFLYISEDIFKVASIMTLTVLICLTTAFLLLIYLLKKELVSKLRSELQKTLIISVIAQLTVTLIFEFCPLFYLFSLLKFKMANSGTTVEILELFTVSHTFVEYCVTLYFVAPYRRYIVGKITIIREWLKTVFPKKNTVPAQHIPAVGFNICTDTPTIDLAKYTE